MGAINVMIVESDPRRLKKLMTCLSQEADLSITGVARSMVDACRALSPAATVDILIINMDQPATAKMKPWAAIRSVLPNARIVALTEGADNLALETAVGVGVHALHRLDVEPGVLCRAVRHAAQVIMDFDAWLIERAKSVVLRPLAAAQVRIGGLTIDVRKHELIHWSPHIHVTPLEFKLLAYLADNTDRLVSIAELLEAVWISTLDRGGTQAQVYNCIKRIRRKIEPDLQCPQYLCCVRGWGYCLHDPIQVASGTSPVDLSLNDRHPPNWTSSEN